MGIVRVARRALVLDGDQAPALAIVRSLGRRGITVDAAERGRPFLSEYSRWVADTFEYPDPLAHGAELVDVVERLVRTRRYDLVIPVAEDTVHPLALARARIEPHARLAIAPTDALETMLDKSRTFALAASLGVPVPWTRTITDVGALASLAAELDYPVVVKPARSIAGARARRTKLNVAYAHSARELVHLGSRALVHGPIVVQEYFRGVGVGLELLADHGEIVLAFQHRRLHELPLTGGGSCLREAVPVDPRLLSHARALVAATRWHGVAMVELKVDEATGAHRLMEVNGRFWGSLPLAIAAGVDFPHHLFELLVEGRRPPAGANSAKIGTICRKLSADVYWHVQVLRPSQHEPLITWPTRRAVVRDLVAGLSPRHAFDVQSMSDPRPGLVDLARTGAWLAERVRATIDHRRGLRAALRSRTRLRTRLAAARSILFVCHGNINRSALAEHHLRSLVGDAVVITSAGFHPEPGRAADPCMVAVARRHGLSLDGARSRVVDAAMVTRADVVLVMEVEHLTRLARRAPSARTKGFLLGAVLDGDDVEITDPYGSDDATFERCFAHVTRCTSAIARLITVARAA
ncbi:ATP-grasp domain-containing protein [Myxococcota bacterium]|nr:ATP-grasp domain-containing protein [Myxococcota bacterium]